MLQRLSQALVEGLLVLALAAMVVLVFGNVVLRYGFNAGIALSDELARFAFVWLTFLGAVAAAWRGEHIRAEFVRARLTPARQRALDFASEAVIVACCVLLIDGAWRFTLLNVDNRAPISGLPVASVTVAGVVAGALLLLLSLLRLWRIVVAPRAAAGADAGVGGDAAARVE